MSFWLEALQLNVDDNRIISMEIISVMSRCPWPNDTYHFQVTEHYQNYWHQVQHSNIKVSQSEVGYNATENSIIENLSRRWIACENFEIAKLMVQILNPFL